MDGGGGAWTHFRVIHSTPSVSETGAGNDDMASEQIRLYCNQNQKYLALSLSSEDLTGVTEAACIQNESLLSSTIFDILTITTQVAQLTLPLEFSGISNSPKLYQFDERYTLSAEQLAHFSTQGYLILRNVIPKALLSQAKRVINAELVSPQGVLYNEEKKQLDIVDNSWSSPEVLALLRCSPVFTYVERLMGKDNLLTRHSLERAQVALRAPHANPPFLAESLVSELKVLI